MNAIEHDGLRDRFTYWGEKNNLAFLCLGSHEEITWNIRFIDLLGESSRVTMEIIASNQNLSNIPTIFSSGYSSGGF